MKRIHLYIYGEIVQGVFFRAHIKERANELDITGFVRNNDDGSVEAIFEGDDSEIDELVEYCKEGPRGALIDDVEVVEEEYGAEFEEFEVRY